MSDRAHRRRRVRFVPGDAGGAEERAALDWLRAQPDLAVTDGDADVVWIHAAAAEPALDAPALDDLRQHLAGGGALLLTLLATTLVTALGLESEGPNDVGVTAWRDEDDPYWTSDFSDWPDFPRIRGFQAYGAHPLFEGLVRGAYSWRAAQGECTARAAYRPPRWPGRGRVIAVERAFQHLDASRPVAWEYVERGAGRVLCVGAHLHFAARDRTLAAQRDRIARNALRHLTRREPAVARWWPRPDAPPPALGLAGAPVASLGAPLSPHTGAVALTSLARGDDPFTLAGRRALVVGGERSGVRDVWVYPLCVVSGGIDLRLDGEVPEAQSVEILPGLVTRRLRTRLRAVEERVLVPLEEGAVILEYEDRAASVTSPALASVPSRLELTLRLPLRLQWPMPAAQLQPLVVTRGVGDDAVIIAVVGRDGRHAALLHVEGRVTLRFTEHPDAPRVSISAELSTPLRLTFAGSVRGVSGLAARLARLERAGGARALAAARAAHAAELHDQHLSLRSPSASVDTALEWAKVRLTSFVATVPGLGTGLVAGFAASRPGWSVSRPGFAWFFGRDACWTGLGLLAAGLFDEARAALVLLASTQDITGKIIHEVSASGSAHYDSADSTPLFLLFLADYARWSGDLATVREIWPAAQRAVEFVLSTDRDGDGLPENTGVGHGWIEMGALGGGAVTSYVAAVWIAALEALIPVARAAGDLRTADRCAHALHAARQAFDRRLVDPTTGRVALHLTADGNLLPDETALASVPVALGALTGAEADATVQRLDDERYTAPWGVRLVPRGHPSYDPTGYHTGTVWPLFTGWAALGDYAAHRGESGFRRLLANTMLCYDRAKGAFDEVLHGESLATRAGVCPDQAWSAAMVVLPLVTGLLGARPDALARKLRLAPHWPREWPHARVARLRVGRARITLEAEEGCLVEGARRAGVRYRVRCLPRGALTLTLEHPVVGRPMGRVLVDGRDVEPDRAGTDACPHLAVTLWLDETHEIQFVEQGA